MQKWSFPLCSGNPELSMLCFLLLFVCFCLLLDPPSVISLVVSVDVKHHVYLLLPGLWCVIHTAARAVGCLIQTAARAGGCLSTFSQGFGVSDSDCCRGCMVSLTPRPSVQSASLSPIPSQQSSFVSSWRDLVGLMWPRGADVTFVGLMWPSWVWVDVTFKFTWCYKY